MPLCRVSGPNLRHSSQASWSGAYGRLSSGPHRQLCHFACNAGNAWPAVTCWEVSRPTNKHKGGSAIPTLTTKFVDGRLYGSYPQNGVRGSLAGLVTRSPSAVSEARIDRRMKCGQAAPARFRYSTRTSGPGKYRIQGPPLIAVKGGGIRKLGDTSIEMWRCKNMLRCVLPGPSSPG